jgi:PKD repeat protein
MRVNFVPTVWCGTPPFGYAWSFGDGISSTNKSATHTFSSPGNYNVTLTITDSAGQIFTSSQMVRVAAQPAPVPPAPPDTSGLLTGVILVLFLVIAASFVILRRRRKPRR